jgi:hypothetical protein
VLPHRETISTGELNSLKTQEECVINVTKDTNVEHLFVRKKKVRQ